MLKHIFLFSFLVCTGLASSLLCFDSIAADSTGRKLQNLPKGSMQKLQKLSAQDVKNLPAGTLEQLPQDVREQLPGNTPEPIQNKSGSKTKAAQPGEHLPSSNSSKSENLIKKLIDNSDINQLEELPEQAQTDHKDLSDNEEPAPESEETDLSKKRSSAADSGSRRVSIIEKQYRNNYASSLANDIEQFGYDIFRSASVKPSSLAVPDDNYMLGTGDHLLIRVWGRSLDTAYPVTVDREGVISIPKIGPVPVAGTRFGDVESVVKAEAEKYIQGINISVTLTKLRSLEVYVVGEVSNPGLHMVPAFSTIFDGLAYAGGVNKTGTLREIKLYRNEKLIQSFDMYDLLLHGSIKSDTVLQNKDILFVREIGKTAAVAGAVNNPAIFEVTGKKSLKALVKLAGGLLPQAFADRIFLKRFDNNRQFVIKDIDLVQQPEAWTQITVQNGDLLELEFMGSSQPYVVRVTGNVWKPDMFTYQPGMKLSDVLASADILRPDSLTKFALLFRYSRETTRTTPMRFPLSEVFSGEYDADLQPYDKIVVLSRKKLGIQENFFIQGAVWNPARYSFEPGMKLQDALSVAGGVKPGARTDRIEVKRQVKKKEKFETQYITLNLDKDSGFALKPNDTIYVPQRKDYSVKLQGHIWKPETMNFHKGMTLSDLLISKDLPSPEDLLKPGAVMEFGLIYRYDSKTTRTGVFRFPLAKVFSEEFDMPLQPFDRVVVLSRQEFGIAEKIHISGAVWKTGTYDFYPGLKLEDAFALAGGFKFGARKSHIEVSRQVIEENRVETQSLLLDSKKDGDFLLQPNDSILIPMIKDAAIVKKVAITGEVRYPGNYTIRENENVSDLIERAGGFTEHAYLYGAKYTSESARKIQQASIDKMVEKIEISALHMTSEKAQTEDQATVQAEQKAVMTLINRLKAVKAEGRVSIKLMDLDTFKNSKYDFSLKDKDTLNIPGKPSFVSVVGSVYSAGSFLYNPGEKIEYYLEKSGGPSVTSDEDHMYLLKANGEIISASRMQGIFTSIYYTDIKPGDTIVVPEDLDRVPYLKRIRDISDIVFKIATTAGVALAL